MSGRHGEAQGPARSRRASRSCGAVASSTSGCGRRRAVATIPTRIGEPITGRGPSVIGASQVQETVRRSSGRRATIPNPKLAIARVVLSHASVVGANAQLGPISGHVRPVVGEFHARDRRTPSSRRSARGSASPGMLLLLAEFQVSFAAASMLSMKWGIVSRMPKSPLRTQAVTHADVAVGDVVEQGVRGVGRCRSSGGATPFTRLVAGFSTNARIPRDPTGLGRSLASLIVGSPPSRAERPGVMRSKRRESRPPPRGSGPGRRLAEMAPGRPGFSERT